MVGNITGEASTYHEVEVLGYQLACGERPDICARALASLETGRPTQIVTLNPEMAVAARRNPQLRQLLEKADMFVPDGVGLAWAARRLGRKDVARYPGVDLAEDLLAELATRGLSVFLLGSQPGVAERAGAGLTARMPGLKIAGCHHGYFEPVDDGEVAALIAGAKPSLLLAGMGFPRQEGFIARYRDELGAPILMGVGGALEVFAGDKRRAPALVQRAGLEWAYRTAIDLNRLKRLGVLPRFVGMVLRDGLGGAR